MSIESSEAYQKLQSSLYSNKCHRSGGCTVSNSMNTYPTGGHFRRCTVVPPWRGVDFQRIQMTSRGDARLSLTSFPGWLDANPDFGWKTISYKLYPPGCEFPFPCRDLNPKKYLRSESAHFKNTEKATFQVGGLLFAFFLL